MVQEISNMIRHLSANDSLMTALLHEEGMPDDFLPRFGSSFLKILHQAFFTNACVVGLGYEDRGELKGIIIATTSTKSAFKQVYRSSFLKLLPHVIRKVFISPKTLQFLIETLRYSNNYKNAPQAEILVLTVEKSTRHKGIATLLMKALKKEFKKRSLTSFKVSTRSTNTAANQFYKKSGGIYQYNFLIYDRTWNVFYYQI